MKMKIMLVSAHWASEAPSGRQMIRWILSVFVSQDTVARIVKLIVSAGYMQHQIVLAGVKNHNFILSLSQKRAHLLKDKHGFYISILL